jgi:hypothetical protein
MKQKRREPKMKNGITPDYEDEIPVINKITIAARTPYEKTILLQRPKGKENRKRMAKVYPILGKLEDMARQVQEAQDQGKRLSETLLFSQLISDLWDEDTFENDILPFVFQGCDGEYLEELEIPDIIAPFMKGVRYLATQENTPELAEALKKSEGEAEAA